MTRLELSRAVSAPRGRQCFATSFDGFYADSCQRVVGIVAVTTGDIAAAEDAAQEAFLRAHARWGRVSRLDRPDLWVAQVATRIAVSSWRKRRREFQLDASLAAEALDSVTRLWARWGLEELSPRQRMAVILHHVHGLPVEEVAQVTGSRLETVRTHLKRGRSRLRRRLGQEEGDE
jgi:RNA polymerase sigma-70 factor (ECF subfamily)